MASILFAAPVMEMKREAEKIVAENGFDIPVILTEDKRAIKDIMAYEEAEIIISRGGIAAELEKIPAKKVVEIGVSFNDIILQINSLVKEGCQSIGVVMRKNILHDGPRDFSLGGVKIFIRPCYIYSEIEEVIEYLMTEEEVTGIAGCGYGIQVAKRNGLKYRFVSSGKSSLETGFYEAMNLLRARKEGAFQLECLNAVMENIHEGILVSDENRQIVFSNKVAREKFADERGNWRREAEKWLQKRQGIGEKVVDLSSSKVLMRTVPLQINNLVSNEVNIFQEVKSIESAAEKVRFSLHQKGLYAKKRFSEILTADAGMRKLLNLAEKFAKTEANVIIYGESGTGKEGMAHSIHNASLRADKPFVSVSCASIPENLIESELFGYVDGAFTGARKNGKKGLFELAHKGTIFLDEIAELPMNIQGRLLRVLQEHEIMRVGDDKIIPLDIRIICATNKNLKQMVQDGTFREDLYYRINVLKLQMLPLRKRPSDILMLMEYYYNRFAPDMCYQKVFSSKIEKILMSYRWPGNIRELKNVAEALACYHEDSINENTINLLLDNAVLVERESEDDTIAISMGTSLKEAETIIIKNMLKKYTPDEVCNILGISRVTLWRKSKI